MAFFQDHGFLIVSMVLNAVLALTLYLPLMAGQLSLATPGFYAIGGYLAAVVSSKAVHPSGTGSVLRLGGVDVAHFAAGSFPVWVVLAEMVAAGGVCGLVGLAVGLPALRLRGIYLALATLAFVELVRVLSLNVKSLGGAVGIFGIPQPFHTPLGYLLVGVPLLVLSGALAYRLEKVRAGRAFVAIREDELAANAMGINPTYNKVLAFTLGAVLAGATGALAAHFVNTWNSRQGTFDLSVIVLAFVIIGGSRTWLGPILGGLALTALPEVLRNLGGQTWVPGVVARLLQDQRLIIYGLLIILAAIFFPQGLVRPVRGQRRAGAGRARAPEQVALAPGTEQ